MRKLYEICEGPGRDELRELTAEEAAEASKKYGIMLVQEVTNPRELAEIRKSQVESYRRQGLSEAEAEIAADFRQAPASPTGIGLRF
jgi:hypothetical protein